MLEEKLVEMIFDRFNAEGVFVQEQALMALYSYKATSGIVGKYWYQSQDQKIHHTRLMGRWTSEKLIYKICNNLLHSLLYAKLWDTSDSSKQPKYKKWICSDTMYLILTAHLF